MPGAAVLLCRWTVAVKRFSMSCRDARLSAKRNLNSRGCRQSASKGFTLVELTITVVILGFLSAASFAGYRAFVNPTNDFSGLSSLQSVARASILEARVERQSKLNDSRIVDQVNSLKSARDPKSPFFAVNGSSTAFGEVSMDVSGTGLHAALATLSKSGKCLFVHFSLAGNIISWVEKVYVGCTAELPVEVTDTGQLPDGTDPDPLPDTSVPPPTTSPVSLPSSLVSVSMVQDCSNVPSTIALTAVVSVDGTQGYQLFGPSGLVEASGTVTGTETLSFDIVSVTDPAGDNVRLSVTSAPDEIVILGPVVRCSLYGWEGFENPTSAPPAVNNVNPGRAIPIKFRLSQNYGYDIFADGSPGSSVVNCEFLGGDNNYDQALSPGNSGLHVNANGRYNFVWDTDRSYSSQCRRFVMEFNDGTTQWVYYKFKKK